MARRRGSPGPLPRGFPKGYLWMLLVLPYVTAVGSNLPFAPVMALASVFWVVALHLVTWQPFNQGDVEGLRHVMQALVVVLVAAVVWTQHHNGPDGGDLAHNLRPAPVAGGELRLSPLDADTATKIRAVAQQYGIGPRTPVVDLSGMGAAYALMAGGRPLGRADFYGYLPGGVAAARQALARVPCFELADAWLVYSPGNDWDVSSALTRGVLDVDHDYERVLNFKTVRAGRTWPMTLLRPRPTVHKKFGC